MIALGDRCRVSGVTHELQRNFWFVAWHGHRGKVWRSAVRAPGTGAGPGTGGGRPRVRRSGVGYGGAGSALRGRGHRVGRCGRGDLDGVAERGEQGGGGIWAGWVDCPVISIYRRLLYSCDVRRLPSVLASPGSFKGAVRCGSLCPSLPESPSVTLRQGYRA
jgi:hypothetical protein